MRSGMNSINKKLASLLIVTLSCLTGLVVIEIGLRFIHFDNPWQVNEEANILRNFQFTYDVSKLYSSDSLNVKYMRNEYGLRDSCVSPDQIEILTIGGSTTDQRYVPLELTYQSRLQERLNDVDDGFGCVSNAGIDGHSTWGHLFAFENWFPLIPELRPKFILLYVGINDANFSRANTPKVTYYQINKNTIKTFLKTFQLVKALLPIYRLIRQSSENLSTVYAGHNPRSYVRSDYKVTEMNEETIRLSTENAEAFKSRMIGLLEQIRTLNAIPVCVTQPHRYVIEVNDQTYGIPNVLGEGLSGIDYDFSIRQLNAVMFELCGQNTLDLYSHSFLNSHFYDGAHTTPLGSQVIGERMADFFIEKFY